MEQTLGKRIMQHRKAMGLTQDQLAERLGVTPQAVSKWEHDLSCPDINMLPRLAELFGTTTDALLGHEKVYDTEVVSKKDMDDDNDDDDGNVKIVWNAGRQGVLGFAIYCLLVGGLLFASRYLGWDVGFWSIAWPSFLLVFGFMSLIYKIGFTNVCCTLLGGYFLIDNLGIFDFTLERNLIFPALIVLFGLSLLGDAVRSPKKGRFHIHKNGNVSNAAKGHFTQEGDSFDCSLSFGEAEHLVTLPLLREGEASASFSEMTLDLTGCSQIADGCELDIHVSFAELNLKVPRKYRVECEESASFGEIDIHGNPDSEPVGVIRVDGSVSFGELNIYYI